MRFRLDLDDRWPVGLDTARRLATGSGFFRSLGNFRCLMIPFLGVFMLMMERLQGEASVGSLSATPSLGNVGVIFPHRFVPEDL